MIAAGGIEPNPKALRSKIQPFRTLVAADGGLRLFQKMNLDTDLLVGDLDTLSESEVHNFVSLGGIVRRFPTEKDASDTELSILEAHREGAQRITIIGALGGEWDHCVGNILAPLSLCNKLNIWARLLHSRASIYLLTPGSLKIDLPLGTRLSINSLSEKVEGIYLDGFAFPLENESLGREETRGLANRTTSKDVRIQIGSGQLLLTIAN